MICEAEIASDLSAFRAARVREHAEHVLLHEGRDGAGDESTGSDFAGDAGLREVIERKGVFCALYSDRGSHFWLTPKVGGKVDPHRLTQVGRALRELGVQTIPAYSPQARGRSERN